MDILFECRRIEFKWEGFEPESFRMYPSLSLDTHTHIYNSYEIPNEKIIVIIYEN